MTTVKLKKYTDARGELVENTREKIMTESRHFFVSKSKPGVVRGNHYHTQKTEWFYIIQGTCRMVKENIKTKKREEIIIKADDNLIIFMKPLQAHAFENIGNDEMILLAFINEPLDKKNPDTIGYKVI